MILIYYIAFKSSADNHHLNPSTDNSIVIRISFCPLPTFSQSLLLYVYNISWTCDLVLIIFILSAHPLFTFWIHLLRFSFSRNRQKSRNSKDNTSSIIRSLYCWSATNMLLVRRHYPTSIIVFPSTSSFFRLLFSNLWPISIDLLSNHFIRPGAPVIQLRNRDLYCVLFAARAVSDAVNQYSLKQTRADLKFLTKREPFSTHFYWS